MKKVLFFVIILLLSASLLSCTNEKNRTQVKEEPQQTVQTDEINEKVVNSKETNSIVYKNTQYGFNFSLPKSWKGYTIVTDEWKGLALGDSQGEKVVEMGPIIYIRHPAWTSQNPRQDIPIMVFTLAQWDALQQEKFHIGAAPIGPKELGRNSTYVFALPARYNYAFPTGFEEVEDILNGNPLQPTGV